MILPRIKLRRLFKLLDPLTVYANERLCVMSGAELMGGSNGSGGLDERAQAEVLNELWQNLGIVDQFIDENPAGMSLGELETIRAWRDSRLTGAFCVWRFPDGHIRLINGNYAFEVCGLSREIEGMLHSVPTFVNATLLPFDGLIVYSEYLIERPVVIGDGLMRMLRESVEKIVSEGAIVTGADAFARASAALHEAEIARDLTALEADLEDAAGAGQSVPGQHRGSLAGMSFEERERAIDAHMNAELAKDQGISGNRLVALLDERCTPGPVKTNLADLLEDMPELDESTLDDVFAQIDIEDILAKYEAGEKRDYAREFLTRNLEEMRAGISREGMAQYLVNPEYLQRRIGGFPVSQIVAYRQLVFDEGRMSVSADGLESLLGLPYPRSGLCYVFREGDTFVHIMPDEVVEVAQGLDWDAIEDHARKHEGVVRFFDAVVELRGISSYPDAMGEYFTAVPDGFADMQEVNDELMDAIDSEEVGLFMLDDGDEVYLLHYELAEAYAARCGLNLSEVGVMVEGPLDDMLSNLLSAQRSHVPRTPTPEMLDEFSVFFWKEKQPPARAMCAYLDEHVPDGAEDYYFADNVMEELLEEAKWTGSMKPTANVELFFEILNNHGFMPDERQMQQLLNLWMNLCNGLPIWANNGWSPAESASSDPEHPLFFNEDGSVKKVGRNDPCPCGSGKKYKRCHGR